MPKLIVANWKMNPDSPARAAALAGEYHNFSSSKLRGTELVVAPPFPFLIPVREALPKGVKLGAQDSFWRDRGPYTGEVSWHQLKNLKVEYVIIGHSERRIHLGETDEMINKKVRAVLENGLRAILCIGERERSGSDIPPLAGEQLRAALAGVKKPLLRKLIIAYEPVWAISTMPGNHGPDTPDSAFRARIYIEKVLSGLYVRQSAGQVRIIYGGSVNSANVGSFMVDGKMDGALVGSASLDHKEFEAIVRSVRSESAH